MPIQCRGYRDLGSFVGLGYEIERRRFTANLSRGELTESRHDLGPRGECQDFPDAMNIVERERHVVSSKRGRMDAGMPHRDVAISQMRLAHGCQRFTSRCDAVPVEV